MQIQIDITGIRGVALYISDVLKVAKPYGRLKEVEKDDNILVFTFDESISKDAKYFVRQYCKTEEQPKSKEHSQNKIGEKLKELMQYVFNETEKMKFESMGCKELETIDLGEYWLAIYAN